MKALYLTLSIVFTSLILILAFGNIGAQCSNLYFLFFPVQSNPTVIIFSVAAIGIMTGVFYHAFVGRILASADEEDEQF